MRHFGAPLFTFCYQKLCINPLVALQRQAMAYQSLPCDIRTIILVKES
jgi:hypothetical protein